MDTGREADTGPVAPLRAFLALDVAPRIHAALVQLKCELAQAGAEVRWVRDEGLHATVKFLGSVEPAVLDAVRAALGGSLQSFPAFSVQVGGLGVFPNLRRPLVVWVGLAARELSALAARVDAAVAAFGFTAESRPFQPHITLGRVKSPRGWPRLEERLKAHWDDEFGTCEIDGLSGYRSDLRRDGAVYTKLWTIPLLRRRGGAHGTGPESGAGARFGG